MDIHAAGYQGSSPWSLPTSCPICKKNEHHGTHTGDAWCRQTSYEVDVGTPVCYAAIKSFHGDLLVLDLPGQQVQLAALVGSMAGQKEVVPRLHHPGEAHEEHAIHAENCTLPYQASHANNSS